MNVIFNKSIICYLGILEKRKLFYTIKSLLFIPNKVQESGNHDQQLHLI